MALNWVIIHAVYKKYYILLNEKIRIYNKCLLPKTDTCNAQSLDTKHGSFKGEMTIDRFALCFFLIWFPFFYLTEQIYGLWEEKGKMD